MATLPLVAGLPLLPASGDASFRRYFRLQSETDSWIVMDAPPPQEDCRGFIRIASLLQGVGLNVPEILAADVERGFVLMSDLGSRHYLDVLTNDGDAAPPIYRDAVRALLQMQTHGAAHCAALPAYDADLLQREMALFPDWLCQQHLSIDFTASERRKWQSLCDRLIDSALAQPVVFVHRDYHSRNLMLASGNNPGILDFQDAVAGPLTYDLVSLLKDCYVRLPCDLVAALTEEFYVGLDNANHQELSMSDFQQRFDLMGVQRHLKAAGIFARLLHRDGKSGYLKDVPRTLRYIVDVAATLPAMDFIQELIVERVLPAMEAET